MPDMMKANEQIIRYLVDTYQPEAVIVYGSFADGSANEHSDFDALVISDHAKAHDNAVIGGTVLDVFVYPPDVVRAEYDPEDFVQIFDGRIILDKNGMAERLKSRVLRYVESIPRKPEAEIRQEVDWCMKMLARTERGDAEGCYRRHWLLCDSLMIYCDIKGLRYFGPKKAWKSMEQTDPGAFQAYSRALGELGRECLAEWIMYLQNMVQ